MSSTSDAAALEVEAMGVTLMRYLSAMGMVLVHYDFLLTLNDEVYLIFFYLLFSSTSQRVPRSGSFGRGPFTGQKPCTTPIAMYLSL